MVMESSWSPPFYIHHRFNHTWCCGGKADFKNIKVTLNGLCGINGATVRLRGGPQIHRQHSPLVLGPGDSFHVPQWRHIRQAFSTLCCPSSNNASKHQINPPPLYPCPSRWKGPEKVKGPSAPTLEIYCCFSRERWARPCRHFFFSAWHCKYATEKCWHWTLFNQPIKMEYSIPTS